MILRIEKGWTMQEKAGLWKQLYRKEDRNEEWMREVCKRRQGKRRSRKKEKRYFSV
jgi:hypothetical protein